MDFFKKNSAKHAFLFFVILISFYRSPYIFLNGRFIAEEADQHYLFALNNSFLTNLFYYVEFAGYYNLIPNITTWFATLVSIENAPYVTVYSSFLIILLLPYLVLFRESLLFKSEKQRIVASFILFLTPPFVVEIWLNTLNSQIYLCIISILILFMKNLNNFQKKINNFLILISGFSGIYSCSLLPLYIHKYFKNQNNYNLINLCFLIIANIIQLFLIFKSYITNKLHYSVLSDDYNFEILSNFIYNIFVKSFFGRDLTHLIWNKINVFGDNHNLYILFTLLIFICIVLINVKKIIIFFKKDLVSIYLISMFIIISFIILVGSINNQIGGRYAVLPSVVLILLVLHFYNELKNKILMNIFLILISSSLITGIYEFRPNYKINLKNPDLNYLKQLDCLSCPQWKSEVQNWRKNNEYIIGLWPYPRKQMKLEIKNVIK